MGTRWRLVLVAVAVVVVLVLVLVRARVLVQAGQDLKSTNSPRAGLLCYHASSVEVKRFGLDLRCHENTRPPLPTLAYCGIALWCGRELKAAGESWALGLVFLPFNPKTFIRRSSDPELS